jgi:amino acid permease
MKKILATVFLAGGIVLIVYGIHASNSLGSDFSKFFTGSPTEKSIWLLIGGVVMTAVGAGGLMSDSKS